MRRLIAFVLLFILTFTSFTIVSIEAAPTRVTEDARALEIIGMLEGDGNGVTPEYMAKRMTRLTAAISILKLKGLYNEAIEYKGYANFKDIDDVIWGEGKNILAYLKASPDVGFIGNEKGEFLPYKNISEKEYFKVLLETLGYKQSAGGKSGDFSWNNTFVFAESKGLKPSYSSDFNIELLASATVSALNTKTKSGKVFLNVLIDSGVIEKSKASSAGLTKEEFKVSIKNIRSVGNTVVEIEFKESIDRYVSEDIDNYSIDGLTVKDAYYIGNNTIRLETSPQSGGKIYNIVIGKIKSKFTGLSKVSGSPGIKIIKSEDIETVVIEFNRELDFFSATDSRNYSISGVDIEKAEVKGREVTLSTYGLEPRKQHTLKITNIKSIDGVISRSQSKTFFSRPDIYPPNVKDVKAETNQRIIVSFSKTISKETAEDLYNYSIKSKSGDLEIYEAILFGDDEDKVELVTEIQKSGTKYEITIDNIADKTKSSNVMKRPVKKVFYGMREDRTAPQISRSDVKVLSRNHIQLAFTDNSRIDEGSVLNYANYEIIKNDRYKNEIYIEDVEKISYIDNKYKLLLEVEDLDMNANYTIKVYDIADEFGNTLEKNNTISISVKRDDFAASTVKDYKVTKDDEIEIYFTKPLNKEAAEDISNYQINNNIGHPTKTEYKDEKVTLNTGTMVEGKLYKLTIDGVKDLANNNLRLSFEFRATKGERDESRPKLEYVYIENKYVVSAIFDKPVRYTTDGLNKTVLVLNTGNTEITLYAKALTDDDRVIEFSNKEEGKTVTGYSTVYTINKDKSFKGITDRSVNRNKFNVDDLGYYDLLIYGSNEEPDPPTVEYITQRDGKTFEVLMTKEVEIKKSAADASPSGSFKVGYTDDKEVVTFTITSRYIDGNKDYKIDISEVLADKHGIKAENIEKGYTIFYGEYTDDDKPYIVDVYALDRFTVEIEYDEAIGYEGKYTIKNTDDSARYKTISNSFKEIDNNKVVLSLENPLEGRYDYYLIIDIPAKDLVGNTSEDIKGDEFYFIGTDLSPIKVPDVDYKEAEALVIKLEKSLDDLSDLDKIKRVENYFNDANKAVNIVNESDKRKALQDRLTIASEKIQHAKDMLAAKHVMGKIESLPTVFEYELKHAEAAETVRSAYDKLSESQQKLVDNYEKLKSIEDKLAALEVVKKIDQLPHTNDITLEHEIAIIATREAYNALSGSQQNLVTNYSKLIKAEEKVVELNDNLLASKVIKKVNQLSPIGSLSLSDKEAVEQARKAYDKLTETQKGFVTNLDKLIEAENKIKDLEKLQEEELARLEALSVYVENLETAVENLYGKVNLLTNKTEEMDNAIREYVSFILTFNADDEEKSKLDHLKTEDSAIVEIKAVETLIKEVDITMESVMILLAAANEAYEKVINASSVERVKLQDKIASANTKINDLAGLLQDSRDRINGAKIKAAKKWLINDMFKFKELAKADSDTPIILPLAVHKGGATFNYKEIGRIIDGKFVKEEVNNRGNYNRTFKTFGGSTQNEYLQFIDETIEGKVMRSIKINRGEDDMVMTLKVEIASSDKTDYKLFNISIPAKSTDNMVNKPVEIEEVKGVIK